MNNNQQKYLVLGIAGALLIVALLKIMLTYGTDHNFWMITLTSIAAGMMYLVFNIYTLTQTLTLARTNQQKVEDKKL